MLFNRDSAIQSASRRFCIVYKSEKSDPLQPFERHDIPSGCPFVQSIIRPDVSAARPDNTQCSTSYGNSFQNIDMGRSL
jgi:hypothetical protein